MIAKEKLLKVLKEEYQNGELFKEKLFLDDLVRDEMDDFGYDKDYFESQLKILENQFLNQIPFLSQQAKLKKSKEQENLLKNQQKAILNLNSHKSLKTSFMALNLSKDKQSENQSMTRKSFYSKQNFLRRNDSMENKIHQKLLEKQKRQFSITNPKFFRNDRKYLSQIKKKNLNKNKVNNININIRKVSKNTKNFINIYHNDDE